MPERLGTFLYPSWFGTVRHVSVTRPVMYMYVVEHHRVAEIRGSYEIDAPGGFQCLGELGGPIGSSLSAETALGRSVVASGSMAQRGRGRK